MSLDGQIPKSSVASSVSDMVKYKNTTKAAFGIFGPPSIPDAKESSDLLSSLVACDQVVPGCSRVPPTGCVGGPSVLQLEAAFLGLIQGSSFGVLFTLSLLLERCFGAWAPACGRLGTVSHIQSANATWWWFTWGNPCTAPPVQGQPFHHGSVVFGVVI